MIQNFTTDLGTLFGTTPANVSRQLSAYLADKAGWLKHNSFEGDKPYRVKVTVQVDDDDSPELRHRD